MAEAPSRPNVVALFVGVIIAAICGTIIVWITQRWDVALAVGVIIVIASLVSMRLWLRRHEAAAGEPPQEPV